MSISTITINFIATITTIVIIMTIIPLQYKNLWIEIYFIFVFIMDAPLIT